MELLPFMEIAVTHTASFVLSQNHISAFSSSYLFASYICTQEKTLAPIKLNLKKIWKELGCLFGPKIPRKGKYTWDILIVDNCKPQ